MPEKRQIHVIPPWGDNTQQSDAILLLELPVDEPYAFAISHTSFNTVVVTIHSGKQTEDAERWCKTHVFTLTSDGKIRKAVYEGKQDIIGDEADTDQEGVYQANNWQEWSYRRETAPPLARDDFAREFQKQFLNNESPVNQPSLDPTEETYLDYSPVVLAAKQTVVEDINSETGQTGRSVKAFALNDTAIDELKNKIKTPGMNSINSTMKPPIKPEDRDNGDKIQAFGRGVDWSETRFREAKVRILGVSTFAENI
jgi:hypothetical protein